MRLRIAVLVCMLTAAPFPALRAEEAATDGAVLFRRTCVMCHGPDGRADTPMGRRSGVKDLTASALGDERIRETIRHGARNAKGAMPAYGAKFSAAELDALVAFVRSLRPAQNAAKP